LVLFREELLPYVKHVNHEDFTVLRNQFFRNLQANCFDRLEFARELDRFRLMKHCSHEDMDSWQYYASDMQLVSNIQKSIEVPEVVVESPASNDSLPFSSPSSSKIIFRQDPRGAEGWRKMYAMLNAAFFNSALPPAHDISWADLPVLSESRITFEDMGPHTRISLHHKLAPSPMCSCVLLHEMVHLWDQMTWKPVEASHFLDGHGYYWKAKVELIQMDFARAGVPWKVNPEDEIPTPSKMQPTRQPRPDSVSSSTHAVQHNNTSTGFLHSLPQQQIRPQQQKASAGLPPGALLQKQEKTPHLTGRYVAMPNPEYSDPTGGGPGTTA
jgi:hypothetical protein